MLVRTYMSQPHKDAAQQVRRTHAALVLHRSNFCPHTVTTALPHARRHHLTSSLQVQFNATSTGFWHRTGHAASQLMPHNKCSACYARKLTPHTLHLLAADQEVDDRCRHAVLGGRHRQRARLPQRVRHRGTRSHDGISLRHHCGCGQVSATSKPSRSQLVNSSYLMLARLG